VPLLTVWGIFNLSTHMQTIVRQSVLFVSVSGHTVAPSLRGAGNDRWHELCAGARVDVTRTEEDDECLCIGPGGHEIWIDRRFLP
jgi:hypothetical protein